MADTAAPELDRSKRVKKLIRKFQKNGVVHWQYGKSVKSDNRLRQMLIYAIQHKCRVIVIKPEGVEQVHVPDDLTEGSHLALIGG